MRRTVKVVYFFDDAPYHVENVQGSSALAHQLFRLHHPGIILQRIYVVVKLFFGLFLGPSKHP